MECKQPFCNDCHYKGYIFDNRDLCAKAVVCPSCSLKCNACSGKGYQKKLDAEGREILSICQCKKITKKIAIFNRAEIPIRFAQVGLNTASSKTAGLASYYKKAQTFVKNFDTNPNGLLLTGRVGCGKTTLACAVLNYLILEKEIECLFIEFTQLLDRIKAHYSAQKAEYNSERTELDLLKTMTQIPVLLIDELAKGKNTDWEKGIIDNLISRRYNANKKTIFTTNFFIGSNNLKNTNNSDFTSEKTKQQSQKQNYNSNITIETTNLNQRIQERTYSRIIEMSEIIEMKGKDLRQKDLIQKESVDIIIQP